MMTIATPYPRVNDEFHTLMMLEQGYSIARFGDGELKLATGRAAKSQEYNPTLSRRLREILLLPPSHGCLVGIPRISPLEILPTEKQSFWAGYDTPQYRALYNPNKVYESAFITRPDSAPAIDCDSYWDRIKALWRGQDVVLIGGNNKPFDKNPDIVDGARNFTKIEVPSQHAFSNYSSIIDECKRFAMGTVFILACGATATVLAYDLHTNNYRKAYDLGHLGMFYARAHEKTPKR